MDTPDDETRMTWITKKSHLPEVCVTCGRFTEQVVKPSYSGEQAVIQRSESMSVSGCLLQILVLPLGVLTGFGLRLGSGVKEERKVVRVSGTIKVRQCDCCSEKKEAKPVQSDGTITYFAFVAHDNFHDEYERLNGSEPT